MSVMMRNGLQYAGVPDERLDNLEEIVGDGQQSVGSDLTDAVTQLNSSLSTKQDTLTISNVTISPNSGVTLSDVSCMCYGRLVVFSANIKYANANTDYSVCWVSGQINSIYRPLTKTWLSSDYYGNGAKCEAWIDTSGIIHIAQGEGDKYIKVSGVWVMHG